jgi:site-specific DNA recombinase
MPADSKSVIRCAIYTRKSSEEGLDQSFNSLEAGGKPAKPILPARNMNAGAASPRTMRTGAILVGRWTDRPCVTC